LEVDIHLRLSHTAVAEVLCTVPAAALSTLLKSSRFLTSVLDWRKRSRSNKPRNLFFFRFLRLPDLLFQEIRCVVLVQPLQLLGPGVLDA
jgi:hypothetical protein